jgi:hypothetical protein
VEARPTRADELPHLIEASGSDWYETWAFELASDDGELGASLGLTLRPSDGVTWFWACIVGRDRPLVAVIDHDVPLPRRELIELRASGLWVDVEIETPGEHVSVGMEAFGLLFESPTDALSARGVRTPVGFDLGWEQAGDPRSSAIGEYRVPCTVVGEVLVGHEQLRVDGTGARSHCWGGAPWWLRHSWSLAAWVDGHPVDHGGEVDSHDLQAPLVPPTVDVRGEAVAVTPLATAAIPVTPLGATGAVLHLAFVSLGEGGRRGCGWVRRLAAPI